MAMSDDCSESGTTKAPAEGQAEAAHEGTFLRSLFRQRGLFSSVADTALDALEAKMRPVQFGDGDVICAEGDPGGWTFVVAAGEVEVLKTAKDGAMIQVNVLRPGNWGGMMSLLSGMPRMARLVARGDVELRVLGHEDLTKLLEIEPSLTMGLLACMSGRLSEDAIHLAATLRYMSVAGPEDVYRHCSPDERLMLETVRHRVAVAESLGEIMDFLFESTRREQDCDRMSLMFLEDRGSRAVSHWTRTSYSPLVLPADFKEDLAGSFLEESLNMGGPRIVNDLVQYSREHPANRVVQRLVREELRATIVTPLIVAGKSIGLLVRHSRRGNAYNEHHALLHQAIAASIAPAVEKAYRIEQLTRANSYYAEVLGFVSHELQSPIAAMVTDAKLLVEGYLGELNDRQQTKLERLIGKGHYLLGLVRDYLNLARLEDSALKANMRADINLCEEVIEPIVDMLKPEIAAKDMRLEGPEAETLPPLQCDPGMLRIALGNLLTNAIKYGRPGGVIRVGVTTDNALMRLTVWNEGPGFTAADRSKLFQKFVRLDDPELRKEKGTGVGLYSTWRIMQLHRGRVTARSEKGAWAEFTLSLPLRQNQDEDVDAG